MNIKMAALATSFLLTTGCAMNGPTNPSEPPNDSSPMASKSTRTQQASAGRPTGRTRAEVHAEAVEAVKNYKSTLEEERDYFNPYAR